MNNAEENKNPDTYVFVLSTVVSAGSSPRVFISPEAAEKAAVLWAQQMWDDCFGVPNEDVPRPVTFSDVENDWNEYWDEEPDMRLMITSVRLEK